jgi:hypothetical protein
MSTRFELCFSEEFGGFFEFILIGLEGAEECSEDGLFHFEMGLHGSFQQINLTIEEV